MARHLVEPAIDLIVSYMKANLPTALAAVRVDRDASGNLGLPTPIPSPSNYFIAKKYAAYQTPALFFVAEDIDFKKDRGANHINATMRLGVAAIVESQTTENVSRISWRYQAALSQVLDNLRLTSSDETFKLVVVVKNADFTAEYTESTSDTSPAGRWRKAVLLKCDVEFYEAL